MIRTYPQRTIVAFSLMISQAFLYNAIFFTESLVLSTFFGVPAQNVGYYIFPFAVGNLLGPLLLGPLFDRVGRKPMIAATYGLSAALLLGTGILFVNGMLDARTIALCWSIVFFFASAGASSAYLTVSETFPVEIRAMAIALVFGVGTLVGGALAPSIFAALIATASRERVFDGYVVAAVAMFAAAAIELLYGVEAAGRRLEEIAAPLATRASI
jgi:MFS family permease